MQKVLANWGNYPKITAEENYFTWKQEAVDYIKKTEGTIARGMGRSYGDSSLAPEVLSILGHNKILSFDPVTGQITCEAGITIDELLKIFVPKGWFVPVVPGTKFVTIGGAIASDIHGKNHHKEGSFSRHVESFRLLTADAQVLNCSKYENPDHYRFTFGGMGLTGIILDATFRLRKIETSFIKQETLRAQNLDRIFDIFEESGNWTYSVAWIDCMATGKQIGKSVMMRGEHALTDDLHSYQKKVPLQALKAPKITFPFYLPPFVLNKWSIKAFNTVFYHKFPFRLNQTITHYEPFFFPLDSILHWNKMYGKPGFVQYQMVFPPESSKEGLHKTLQTIERYGFGSFLAVLKLFGEQNTGNLSFSMKGYTLALDFPVNKEVFLLLKELDSIVADFGGRIYLTKDARMDKELLAKGYPHLEEFKRFITSQKGYFHSLQSNRLGLT